MRCFIDLVDLIVSLGGDSNKVDQLNIYIMELIQLIFQLIKSST